ncbi:glucocorticoid modulatory element-binding protein 2-like isoform X2 [Petromyzon marinus]|uniref:Glucocorticoid modulatory element-binding protein 2-like isoform X2 n=1 Tax=Petromyzon marinus TaxID=7757 RepID=A0AAJ7TZ88_PETMA|nr:glucocorticoid modulatory element-binding protein 2-like isoform X2 [Petromyzon marinus]
MATSEVGGEGEAEIVMVTVEETPNSTDSAEDSSAAMMVQFKQDHAGAAQTDDNIESVYSANTLVEKMANSGDVTEEKGMEEVEEEEEEVDDGEGTNLAYPITCGDNKATLLLKKFVCPGINVPCVKFNTGLISPKEFVNMAGKSTLKDWKRAIRMRGVMLRKVMDSGELDFYQHDKVCTSTCRSTKFDILINNVRLPIIGTQGEYSMVGTPSDVNGAQVCGGAEEAAKDASELVSTPSTSFLPSTPCTDSARAKDASELPDEVFSLWKGIADVGLLGEVVNEVQQEIQDTLKALRQRIQLSPLQMSDATTLNGVVQHFGLMDNVKKILGNHKSQMGRYRDQYTRDLAELERQCDDQRRRSIEQKQRQQLTTLSPSAIAISPPPAKRPRAQRASASVPTMATIPGLTTIPMAKLPTLATIPVAGVGGKQQPAFAAGTTTATYGTMAGTPGGLTVIGSQAIISTASGLKVLSPVQFVSAQGGDGGGGGIVSAAGLGAMLQGAQVVSGPGTMVTLQPVPEATVAAMVSAAAASTAVPGALPVQAAPAAVPMEGEQAASDVGASVAP